MKRIAENVFYNWKTTLLGIVIFGTGIYLVEKHIIDNDLLKGLIDGALAIVGGWLAFNSKDKLPRMGQGKDKDLLNHESKNMNTEHSGEPPKDKRQLKLFDEKD